MNVGFDLSPEEIEVFLEETAEHLDVLEADILAMERDGVEPERLARMFRAAHTIKGAAATVGHEPMARLTHALETLLDPLRRGQATPGPDTGELLLRAVDGLRSMATALRRGHVLPGDDDLTARLEAAARTMAVPGDRAMAATAGGAVGSWPSSAPAGGGPAAPAGAGSAPGPVAEAVVHLSADCAMPAVRALQALLAAEDAGRVLGSDPDREAVEAERVGDRLTVWVEVADATVLERLLRDVPDVAAVEVRMVATPVAAEASVAGMVAAPVTAAPAPAAVGEATAGRPGDGPSSPVAGGGGADDEARTVRVDVAVLDDFMNLVGELVIDRGRIHTIGERLAAGQTPALVGSELNQVAGHLARVTSALQEAVLKARMLPVTRVFRKFPRMVRDLAHRSGKTVEFRLEGEDTELDRSVIELIGDPILHLLRNAVDHGLETPAERRAAGKPEAGTLVLAASHEENHVVITVSDDGRGIHPEAVRAAAVRKGIVSAERARELTDAEVVDLLFAPGFSTASQVTDISGRGVGLDVVRRNVERAGGRVEVETAVGAGTTFRLLLPLTLATIRALLVRACGETLAIPLSAVSEILQLRAEEVARAHGQEVTVVRGRVVPLRPLASLYEQAGPAGSPQEGVTVVVVHVKGRLYGLCVDDLVGEQEVVVKGLGEYLGRLPGLGGATILGDGSIALILDVPGTVHLLMTQAGPAASLVPSTKARAS